MAGMALEVADVLGYKPSADEARSANLRALNEEKARHPNDPKAQGILDNEIAKVTGTSSVGDQVMAELVGTPQKSRVSEPVKVTAQTTAPAQPAGPGQPAGPSATSTDVENFKAGAGKGVVDLGRGLKQLLDIPAQWLEKKFPGISAWSQSKLGMPSAAKSAADTNADVAESRTLDAPLMDTKAGIGGDVAGNIAATMLPLGAAAKVSGAARALLNPTTYKAAAAAGAAQGLLQPTIEGESKATNAAAGAAAGAAGNAAINALGRVAQPIQGIVSSAHDKAVSVLEKNGINLDAAQKSGSAILSRVRSALFDNPWTTAGQHEIAAHQQAGFNRAVLKTIGEHETAATPEVMGAAQNRINGTFQRILDRNNVTITDTALNRMAQVQASAAESEKKPVVSIANRILQTVDENGEIKGQVAYGIKKDLDRLASSADTDLAYHARQLRTVLMDTINGSLDSADRKAFAEARGQFANMKTIETAIDKHGSGDISPARLANVMGQKRNRVISVYGKGPQELVDLAHAGNMLLGDKLPQSGTAPRLAMQAVLPVAGAVLGSNFGDSKDAGLGAGAGILLGAVGPRAAQMAINNRAVANYLSKGMQGKAVMARSVFLSPQTNAAVGGSVRRVAPALVNAKKP